MKTKSFLAGAVAIASLTLAAASAQATTEVFNFADNVDGVFAIGAFTVDNTANANGTFDITNVTGTVINASQQASPVVDQITGLVSDPNAPNPTVGSGFTFDNVTPLDANGVLFSGQSGALYDLRSDGGGAGELSTFGVAGVPSFDVRGSLSVGGLPEPATWAMMLIGFAGLGVSLRGAGRRARLAA